MFSIDPALCQCLNRKIFRQTQGELNLHELCLSLPGYLQASDKIKI